MIRLDFADWPSVESIGPIESGGGPSLITGEPTPLPLGSLVIQADPFAAVAPDDDPVTAAEGMRGNAQRALDLMQTTVSANRDLDNLMTSVIDAPDWRDGVTKFDKGLAELKQKHLPRFKDAEDSTAFARELEEFAAIRRIDLKSALARKQQDEALTGLDDALTYYATQAAAARHDQFREIAIERGLSAIDRMAAAGYLFPETAKKLEAQFHARVDAADLESIVSANPDEALGILDNPALFPRADAATREALRRQLDEHYGPVTGARKLPQLHTDPPVRRRTMEFREGIDGRYGDEPVPLDAPAAEAASFPEPHHSVGVGDYENPLNAESGNRAVATDANEQPPTYHPEVLGDLQGIVENTSVISRSSNRIILESPDHKVLVRLEFDGNQNTWLLTAYHK